MKVKAKPTIKPNKPRPDFPLFAHSTGYWAKKVRGKLYYFGKWDDPQAALDEWNRVKEDLLAGREPQPKDGQGVTLRELVNRKQDNGGDQGK